MNGVTMPSVSAGSSQRDASVMWTPHVIVPSGAAVAGRAAPKRTATARSTTTVTREVNDPPVLAMAAFYSRAFHRRRAYPFPDDPPDGGDDGLRSEERRVGKECRS